MKLTPVERLILANQFHIREALAKDSEKEECKRKWQTFELGSDSECEKLLGMLITHD